MNILLVEDEKRVYEFISAGLKADGYSVTVASDGETALDYLKTNTFDVVVLDLMLPGISGQDVCRKMRAKKNYTPVLMLTALDETDERVDGLHAGADDYMCKPFEFDELVARIEALGRRATTYNNQDTPSDQKDILHVGAIKFDRASLRVHKNDQAVDLTEKERDILALFMLNPGRVIARERILNAVWGADVDPLTNVVDVYIGRLRKKLSLPKEQLTNLRGVGYRLSV